MQSQDADIPLHIRCSLGGHNAEFKLSKLREFQTEVVFPKGQEDKIYKLRDRRPLTSSTAPS